MDNENSKYFKYYVGFSALMIAGSAAFFSVFGLSIALTNMSEGMNKEQAMIESMKINFTPVFLTSFTTAVGMAGVNFGKIPAFSEMANTVVIGSGYSFIFSVTLLPALFMIMPVKSHGSPRFVLGILRSLGKLIYKFKN